jgi:hypothetical protein
MPGPLERANEVVGMVGAWLVAGLLLGGLKLPPTSAGKATVPVVRPALSWPEPPSDAERSAFRNIVEDTDVARIPPCRRAGLATTDCRDPMSYLTTNERLQAVWLPFIENLGGAYMGVGADQSYSFIAAARSRWAWIFDYDPQVVRLHRLVQALVREAETPDAFVAFFSKSFAAVTRERLRRLFEESDERDAIVELFNHSRASLASHYRGQLTHAQSPMGWLNSDERYTYVRRLIQQGRVMAVKGNLLTDKLLPSVAAAARALDTPVRIFYPSNAEEMWKFTDQYRSNISTLPFDDKSVILRTLFNKRGHWDAQRAYWHYVVHHGLDAQRRIVDPRVTTTHHLMRARRPTAEPVLSAIGFP